MITPEKEVRANILGRVLYEELRKKGYSNQELKIAAAWMHDRARDEQRNPRARVTDEQLAPTMKIIDGMRGKSP